MEKSKKGKIITITSTKGGVGKTITTLNLAGIYSNMGLKTLIIDLDIYGGNIATFVNSTLDRTIFNFIDDYTHNRYKGISDYIFSYNENIDIIASVKDPRMANKIDFKYIPILLNAVVYKYDVILLDTTHTLNDINIVTLDNSDVILYILTNDSFDLKNTRSFINIIKDASFSNVYTVLNGSITGKAYYSMYDIRNIIDYNIDFTFPKTFYIRNIDKYIIDGVIPTLDKGLNLSKKMMPLANFLIEDKEVKKWKNH